ncbi:MAG: DUF3231 family protein [Mycobacterium leprae]
MNLLESIIAAATADEPPLHVGEVMSLWTYAADLDDGRVACLFMLNHTADTDLKRLMEHFVADVEEPQSRRLHEFMRESGIPAPATTADKPKADHELVPPGAKLTDFEIANILVTKMLAGLNVLSAALTQSVRADVARMLLAFFHELLKESFVLKQTMAQRGWLKMPPSYLPDGLHQ